MFNHWATGLRSGLLPQVVVLKKGTNLSAVVARVLILGARGWILGGIQQVLGGLPHVFYRG